MLRIILLLAACAWASEGKGIILPSGEKGYSIRCDNENINACYEMAGEICHRGYVIQNQNSEAGFETSGSAYVGPGFTPGSTLGVAGSSSKSTSEKGFLIQCKDPEVTEYERSQRERKRAEEQEEDARRSAHQVRIFMGGALIVIIGVSIFSALSH